MRIVVCVKQVPNTTEIRIDPITNTLKREGIPSIINPDDKAALEFALRIKDNTGASVTTITMGPPQAEIMLKETLAMGADQAVLVSDRAFAGSDTLATSRILSASIDKIGYDLIIAGRQAIDGDTAQVGPQIAELLDIAQVTYVTDISCDDNHIVVKRQFEDGYQMLQLSCPALLTVLGNSVEPRYMSVGGIVDQQDKAITTITLQDIDIDVTNIGLGGSPTKVHKTFTKPMATDKQVLELDTNDAVDAIVAVLKQQHII